jgi:hypothetical protein
VGESGWPDALGDGSGVVVGELLGVALGDADGLPQGGLATSEGHGVGVEVESAAGDESVELVDGEGSV